jgi:hypothetical protein
MIPLGLWQQVHELRLCEGSQQRRRWRPDFNMKHLLLALSAMALLGTAIPAKASCRHDLSLQHDL